MSHTKHEKNVHFFRTPFDSLPASTRPRRLLPKCAIRLEQKNSKGQVFRRIDLQLADGSELSRRSIADDPVRSANARFNPSPERRAPRMPLALLTRFPQSLTISVDTLKCIRAREWHLPSLRTALENDIQKTKNPSPAPQSMLNNSRFCADTARSVFYTAVWSVFEIFLVFRVLFSKIASQTT